jgi:hypothetical protein
MGRLCREGRAGASRSELTSTGRRTRSRSASSAAGGGSFHESAALSHAVDAPFDIAAFGEERQPCAGGSRESGINRVPPDKRFRCLVPTVQVIAPATK